MMTIVERLSAQRVWAVREVAEALDCHIMMVYGWVDKGKIPHMRIGRRLKFDGVTLIGLAGKRTLA
jgi:excisionase family DNA binding protein